MKNNDNCHNLYYIIFCSFLFWCVACTPSKKLVSSTNSTHSTAIEQVVTKVDTVRAIKLDTVYQFAKGDTAITVYNSYYYGNSRQTTEDRINRTDTIYLQQKEVVRESKSIIDEPLTKSILLLNGILLVIILLYMLKKRIR